jgi:hypothetical protein
MSARAAARVWSRGYVNWSRGWICRPLALAAPGGVAITTADPATWWDDPSNPPGDVCVPLPACVPVGGTPDSCDPPGCVPPPSYVPVGGAPPSCDPPSFSCSRQTTQEVEVVQANVDVHSRLVLRSVTSTNVSWNK